MNKTKGVNDSIKEIMELLSQIENDYTVPTNVRSGVKFAYTALSDHEKSLAVRVDKSLQELDEISDDPNIPIYTRTQIWNVVSMLESLE